MKSIMTKLSKVRPEPRKAFNDQPMKTLDDLQDVVKEASTSKEQVLYIQGFDSTGKKRYFAVSLEND